MLTTTDQVVARIVKWWWMEMALNGDKTCEIVPTTMGKRCRRRKKTHFLMHADAEGRERGMPNLIAELHPGPPLGPYTEDMVERLMDDSVRLGFWVGMSSYALRLFIRDTARGEVYVYRYRNTRVCTELVWVDEGHNNNTGFLEAWNETRRCTRFYLGERETPRMAGEVVSRGEGGPLPSRWKRAVGVPIPAKRVEGGNNKRLPPGKIERKSRQPTHDAEEEVTIIVIDDE